MLECDKKKERLERVSRGCNDLKGNPVSNHTNIKTLSAHIPWMAAPLAPPLLPFPPFLTPPCSTLRIFLERVSFYKVAPLLPSGDPSEGAAGPRPHPAAPPHPLLHILSITSPFKAASHNLGFRSSLAGRQNHRVPGLSNNASDLSAEFRKLRERGKRGREASMCERHTDQMPLACPQLRTWPTMQMPQNLETPGDLAYGNPIHHFKQHQ
ncbi:uncharacterized protein LOC128627784 [Artibeus jamaicensis]|uniref:uncharacterized protein LOC128627784 n=1 Tax=Artibeus jamaicensis TaxID=9417 RepID=UPI00235AE7C9|nr:uncharacterized protein LOC128627784 [Artibeus jamaicensis]